MLVIELKRDQSTDATVGQVLRYIGWVEKHLAQPNGKTVEGLIIAHELDKTALYALSTLRHVNFMTYEIEFRLSSSHL
jgi:RecB family endonuclease NucS